VIERRHLTSPCAWSAAAPPAPAVRPVPRR
jgi:hypothetical protein